MTRLGFLLAAFSLFTLVAWTFGHLRSIPPRWRTRLGGLALAGMFLAAVSSLSAILFPEVLVVASVGEILATCSAAFRAIVSDPAERWPSIVAGVLLAILLGRFAWAIVAGVRATRRARVRSSEPRWRLRTGHPVYVLPVEHPEAFSVGWVSGQVVVTRGLLALLDEEERTAVLLHEEGHLRARHHLLLVLARSFAAALAPHPATAAALEGLEQAIEEAADEYAAAGIGNPVTVATGLAKAALAGVGAPVGVPSLGDGPDVPARVRRLLEAPPHRWWVPALCLGAVVVLFGLLVGTQIVAGFAVVAAVHHLFGVGAAMMCSAPN